MSKIKVKYKTRSTGLVVMPKESMEEAENLVKYLKQLSGFEVLGIFVNGKLVEGSKPEKKRCNYWSVCRHRDDDSPTCNCYLEASGYCGTCKALDKNRFKKRR